MTPDPLVAAICAAHDAAQCDDYYCGCWDTEYNREPWAHTTKFLAALRERGYVVVRA